MDPAARFGVPRRANARASHTRTPALASSPETLQILILLNDRHDLPTQAEGVRLPRPDPT
jgi:hypothetical protein